MSSVIPIGAFITLPLFTNANNANNASMSSSDLVIASGALIRRATVSRCRIASIETSYRKGFIDGKKAGVDFVMTKMRDAIATELFH